jgi:cell division cycle protein 37
MSRVTDYSKWDHIDLSDDEETYHPNIDSSLMIKINREQRARREAEEKKERDQVAKKLKEGKLTEKEAEKELKKIDQKSKINVDNAGVVTTSRTVINSKPDYRPPRPPKDEEDEQMQLDKFIRKYTPLLEKYVETTDFAACEKFLLDEANSKMLTEQACSAMLLHQLDLQMAGKVAQSKKATRQYLILRNIMDLKNEGQGYSPDKPVDPRQMVFKYFQSMNGKSELQQELKEKTETFHAQIAGRAVQKKYVFLQAPFCIKSLVPT